MPVCVHNFSTEQLHLGGFHCKAVEVTLLEIGMIKRNKERQREKRQSND